MKGKNVLPSVQSWDDMHEHVYFQMEQNIKGGKEKAEKATGDDASNLNACQIQSGTFPGWMVLFYLVLMVLNLVTTLSGFKNVQIVRWDLAKSKLEELSLRKRTRNVFIKGKQNVVL
jgi:hypothetical protein